MSQLQKYQNKLQRDTLEIKKKPIHKPRKRNQYSVEFKFASKENIVLIKKTLIIQSILPRQLTITMPFRLDSDLQIPQCFQQQQCKLGELEIDLFSANYKVSSVQTRKNLILLNLEPFDIQSTDFEQVQRFFKQIYPQICESLAGFQKVQTETMHPQCSNLNTIQDLHQLEAYTDDYPLAGYIARVKDGRRQTITKFLNKLMLDFMQITLEMMKDYVNETNNIPYGIYKSGNYFEQIDRMYKQNQNPNHSQTCFEYQNYSGQRLYLRMLRNKKLIIQESNNSFLEYYFYWIEDFSQSINREQIKLNELEYFNKNQKQNYDSSFLNNFYQQDYDANNEDLEQHPRCGYKNIS